MVTGSNLKKISPTVPFSIAPFNGEEIPPDAPLLFQWAIDRALPGLEYSFKIYEVQPGQTANEAINNIIHFEETGLVATALQYPAGGQDFEPGKPYVWFVTSVVEGYPVVQSELGWFTTIVDVMLDTLKPASLTPTLATPGQYKLNPFYGDEIKERLQRLPCSSNILENGSFIKDNVPGAMSATGQITGWSNRTGASNSPEVEASGCGDLGSVSMWGNKVVREAIQQEVQIIRGHTYRVSLCVKNGPASPGRVPDVQFAVHASKDPLLTSAWTATSPDWAEMGVTSQVTSTDWKTVTLSDWVANEDYDYITVSVTN